MRKGKAFTLIELLVVISIVTLLMALVLPSLQRARNQAKAVVCQVNLSNFGKATAIYLQDNEGRIIKDAGGMEAIWFLRGEYKSIVDPNSSEKISSVETKGITLCPLAVKPTEAGFTFISNNNLVLEGMCGGTFNCWEIQNPAPAFRGSYGANEWQFKHARFSGHRSFSRRFGYSNIYGLRGLSNVPLLLDAGMMSSDPDNGFSERPPKFFHDGRGFGMIPFCINRHNEHVNCLFMDWSVRKVGLKELWKLKWHENFNTAGPWTKAGGVQPEDWPEWMRNFKDY